MTAARIDGKAFSEKLVASITVRVAQLKEAHDIVPGLAVSLLEKMPLQKFMCGTRLSVRPSLVCGLSSTGCPQKQPKPTCSP